MKIIADVETVNRLLPSVSMKSRSRSSRAQLCLGRKGLSSSSVDDREAVLLVCTQQDRNGTKYKLKANVECVFSKFISEGKCTIRFHEPPVDLCISKADSLQLKSFLTVVHSATQGKVSDSVTLTPLTAASTRQVAKLKTKLVITSRAEYPVTSAFPSGLEMLSVRGCSLLRIEPRIMRLARLVSLDLSDNHIAALPDDWTLFSCLAELRLSRNHLVEVPAGLTAGVRRTLAHLDLSHNQLVAIPPSVYDLTNLAVLRLDANRLVTLGGGAGISRLARLVHLSAASNELRSLPADFDRLSLQSLDLFGNAFDADEGRSSVEVDGDGCDDVVPSLFELAGRCIRNNRVPYSAADVGCRNAAALNAAVLCTLCSRACLLAYARCRRRIDLRRVSASVVAVDAVGRMHVHCDGILCSPRCVTQFLKKG